MPLLFAVGVILAETPALAAKARIYNLQTGVVSTLEYKNGFYRGNGKIFGTLPSGIKISGDFVTFAEGSSAWGRIYNDGGNIGTEGGGTYAQKGSAILTGPSGFVLECEYVTRPGGIVSSRGSGVCKDNMGVRYRLMF